MIAACRATNRYDILRDVTRGVTSRKSQKRLDRANAALVVIRVRGTFPGAGKSCEK